MTTDTGRVFIPDEGWKTLNPKKGAELWPAHRSRKPRKLHPNEIRDLPVHLSQIAELYEQLPTIDEPSPSAGVDLGDAGKNDHKPGPAAPINLVSLHLTDTRQKRGWRTHNPGRVATIHRLGTLPALMWWVQLIEVLMDDAHVEVPGHPEGDATVATESAWLSSVQPFILAQPWSVLFIRDIAKIQATLDEAVTGYRQFVPRCGTCSRTLDPNDEGGYVCPGCARIYTAQTAIDLGRRQPPLLTREIAKILKISPATIRTWKDRGLIKPIKRDTRGRQLYSLADALRVKDRVRDNDKHGAKAKG